MGACSSSCFESEGSSGSSTGGSTRPRRTAKIILPNGVLLEYSFPTAVRDVLATNPSCILCNSDSLSYDQTVPALDQRQEIELGCIYFVLPDSTLDNPLSANDMAALAVRASTAMAANISSAVGKKLKKKKKKKKKKRIKKGHRACVTPVCDRPLVAFEECFDQEKKNCATRGIVESSDGDHGNVLEKGSSFKLRSSGSVRRLSRNASARAKLAIWSFRMRLNTIYEGIVVE